MNEQDVTIRPLSGPEEAQWCARLMANSEPWLTLRRDYQEALSIFTDPDSEQYIALLGREAVGFVVIVMKGNFTGYIKSVAVAPAFRSRGLGRQLLSFAEKQIFRESPNAFICVSSFNRGAKRLYERMGYDVIGLLPDYVVSGHGEYLMRKSLAPITEFKPLPPNTDKEEPNSG